LNKDREERKSAKRISLFYYKDFGGISEICFTTGDRNPSVACGG
jgi:hypothetical protein